MNPFKFQTDFKGEHFCREIADEMVSLFKISMDEAVGRINREWVNVRLVGDQHAIYHDIACYYAKDIYYGHDSRWWKDEAQARPKSFP